MNKNHQTEPKRWLYWSPASCKWSILVESRGKCNYGTSNIDLWCMYYLRFTFPSGACGFTRRVTESICYGFNALYASLNTDPVPLVFYDQQMMHLETEENKLLVSSSLFNGRQSFLSALKYCFWFQQLSPRTVKKRFLKLVHKSWKVYFKHLSKLISLALIRTRTLYGWKECRIIKLNNLKKSSKWKLLGK